MEWNEERIALLTKLWREGQSASQVSRQLGGVSRCAVIGKVHRMGLAAREAPRRPRMPGATSSTPRRVSVSGMRPIVSPTTPRATRAAPDMAWVVAPTATIVTLGEHGCRWPIGEPEAPDFGFCGRLKARTGAYCAGHAPMSTRRRETPMKAKDIDRIVSRYGEEGPVSLPPPDELRVLTS
jgi:GcrA cell cycle regulator